MAATASSSNVASTSAADTNFSINTSLPLESHCYPALLTDQESRLSKLHNTTTLYPDKIVERVRDSLDYVISKQIKNLNEQKVLLNEHVRQSTRAFKDRWYPENSLTSVVFDDPLTVDGPEEAGMVGEKIEFRPDLKMRSVHTKQRIKNTFENVQFFLDFVEQKSETIQRSQPSRAADAFERRGENR